MVAQRIVFMGTPAFAVPALRALVDGGHPVVAAYSQPPRPAGRGQVVQASPVQALAEQYGIPVETPVSLKDAAVQARLAAWGADLAVVAAYGLLLPPAVLAAFPRGCLNIHPSLLPRWRGAAPIQRTLLAGDTHTGMCIMQMDAGLDTGPVLDRVILPVPPDATAGTLHDTLAELGAARLLHVLAHLDALTPEPQATEGVTYAARLTRADSPLDWRAPAAQLERQVRGLNPWPGATLEWHGETLRVWAACVVPGAPAGAAASAPGTVLDTPLTIACGEGTALQLLSLQRPGRARMESAAFLNGCPIPPGTQLAVPSAAHTPLTPSNRTGMP